MPSHCNSAGHLARCHALLFTFIALLLHATCESSSGTTADVFLATLARTQNQLKTGSWSAGELTNRAGVNPQRSLQADTFPPLPIILHSSARLLGSVLPASSLPQPKSHATQIAPASEPLRRIDVRDLPPRPLLLPQGVELGLEDMALTGLQAKPDPTEGHENGAHKNGAHNGPADLASMLTDRLLHPASRGRLVFKDVVLELESCKEGELEALIPMPLSISSLAEGGPSEERTTQGGRGHVSSRAQAHHAMGWGNRNSDAADSHDLGHSILKPRHDTTADLGRASSRATSSETDAAAVAATAAAAEAALGMHRSIGHNGGVVRQLCGPHLGLQEEQEPQQAQSIGVAMLRHKRDVRRSKATGARRLAASGSVGGQSLRPLTPKTFTGVMQANGVLLEFINTEVRCPDVLQPYGGAGSGGIIEETLPKAVINEGGAIGGKEHVVQSALHSYGDDGEGSTLRQRRQLLAAVVWTGARSVPGSDGPARHSSLGLVPALLVCFALLATVGGVWLQRLFSCACMGPPATPAAPTALDFSTRGGMNGIRSFHKTSAAMIGGSSQNHTLSALSRFSAQLRKGDDISVRDGSRGGAALRLDGSVRSGIAAAAGSASPLTPLPPALLKELTELKHSSQGRLATVLQGIWQQQQRVMVKVLSHSKDCSYMLEQVGEVWTRLSHPNIVGCCAAEIFPAAALTTLPHVTELLPKSVGDAAELQTWLVLERCENGSLATMLAQRYQQFVAARKASPLSPGSCHSSGDIRDGSPARQLAAKRLGPSSRGRTKGLEWQGREALPWPPSSTLDSAADAAPGSNSTSMTGGPVEEGEGVLLAPPPVARGPLTAAPPPPTSPVSPFVVVLQSEEPQSLGVAPCGPGQRLGASGAPGGSEEGGEGSSPGLLPVADVLSIAHDIASGLAYLHSLDLCHGDLRAENVLVQTVILPSTARDTAVDAAGGAPAPVDAVEAVGTSSGSGDGGGGPQISSVVDMASSPYGDSGTGTTLDCEAVTGVGAGGRAGEDGLAAMYFSTGGRSDVTDASGVGVGTAIAGASGRGVSANGTHRLGVSQLPSYGGATPASCGVGDSCTQAWTNSLRNGSMTSSTFASNVTGHNFGGGSAAPPFGRTFETASVDERLPHGSLTSQGPVGSLSGGQHCYLQHSALAGRPNSPLVVAAGGRLPPPAASAAANGGGTPARAVSPIPDSPENGSSQPNLSLPAVAALSRGIGLTGSASANRMPGVSPVVTAAPATPFTTFGHGGTPFIRRQSNSSLSLQRNNSSNDVSLMSKALSGLTAWPESPQEGRHVLVTAPGGGAGGGGLDSTANSVIGGSGSGFGAGSLSRAGSGAGVPARRSLVVGGLKSALSAPDSSIGSPGSLPGRSALAVRTMSSQASVGGDSVAVASGLNSAVHVTHGSMTNGNAATATLATAAAVISEAQEANGKAAVADVNGAPAAATVPREPSEVLSPRAITAHVDSPISPFSSAPSPRGAGVGGLIVASANVDSGASSPAPSTTPPGRSHSTAGVVCTIASHHNRRCSAPPVVALPVIRRVAKVSDPWLSLARLPTECAGGPWSPEAAAAVGATSGADVSHLPPELLLSGRLHPSSDVYSLAILMWRMLSPTGAAPYAKLRPAEVAYKVVACGMRPAFSPAVPEQLRRLVEDCWQSDPAARPTVQQLLQRLTDMQPQATALQRQWRERYALFGAVSTVSISAVAVLPLRGEQNEVASRWAEAAGIKLLRSSTSWVSGSAGAAAVAARGELTSFSSFVRATSSRGGGGGGSGSGTPYTSMGASGSAAHLYQQPPLPTPPGHATTASAVAFANDSSKYFNVVSEAPSRGSQSNYPPVSPAAGQLPVQPGRRAVLDPF